jgi:hypothetical protein
MIRFMPTRASRKLRKPPRDVNELAKYIVDVTTGETPKIKPPQRNPAAVALGKLGASKGGKARAAKLTPTKRKAIAKKAAQTRWSKKPTR